MNRTITNKVRVNLVKPLPPRIIYSAGQYDNDIEYKSNALQTVYVELDGFYYYLDKQGTFKGINPRDSVALNNGTWRLMDNFQIVLTDTIIANGGKVGGWVFYDGWFISQYGVDKNGKESTKYEDFPNGTFIPNIQMNAKTGNTIQNDAVMNNATINNAYVTGKISNTPSDFTFVGVEDEFLNFDKSYNLRVVKSKQGDEFYYGVARLPRVIHKRDMNAVFTITAGLYSEAKILKIGLDSTPEYPNGAFIYPNKPRQFYDSSYNYAVGAYMFLHTTQAMTFTAQSDSRYSSQGRDLVSVVWKPNIPLDNMMTTLIIADKKAYMYDKLGEYCISEELPLVNGYRVIGKDILDLYPIDIIRFENTNDQYRYRLESSFVGRNLMIYNDLYRTHLKNGSKSDIRIDRYNMHRAMNSIGDFLISTNQFYINS